MKRVLMALTALVIAVGIAAPAHAVDNGTATGTEKVTVTLSALRSDVTKCSMKIVLTSATPNRYYRLDAGNPSQGYFALTTDRRGTLSSSVSIAKSVLQAASSTFSLSYVGADVYNTPVPIPGASFKVTNRCTA